jgi:two-component system sensor histidine kinase KdpD
MRLRNSGHYWRRGWQAGVSGLAIAVATFTCYKLHFNAATVVLLYLLVIVWQSLAGGFILSATVALIAAACLDFFFLPPLLSWRIADPLNVLAFVVFVVIALVITQLVSRLRAEADQARRRGTDLDQLYHAARQLLLVKPGQLDATPLLKAFRDRFAASAVCLFEADTAELHMLGASQCGLAERTRQAYIAGEDADDPAADVVIRCLRVGGAIAGAIGIEGLPDPEWTAGPLSALAATALQQAGAFRKASYETAAAQVETFRTAILDALGHEFKTPLATILAVVGGLLESHRLGAEEREMASLIELETSRLSNLTNRLLRMARLDREEVKPRMTGTDIPALVERVVCRYAAQPHERQVTMSCQCPCALALADSELLDLALTQLLDNAFKFSLPGSAVTVGIGVEDGLIAVRVRNEGSSIAPHERDRIFERYYRGADVRKAVSGAGLGLYVARKIVVAHGGSLTLDNNTCPGTVVFCLMLPRLEEKSRRPQNPGSALPEGSHHVPTNN